VRRQLSGDIQDSDEANAEASDEDEVSSQVSSGSSSRSPSTNGDEPALKFVGSRQASKTKYDQSTLHWNECKPIDQRLAKWKVTVSDPRLKKVEEHIGKSYNILQEIADITAKGNIEKLDERRQTQPVVRSCLDACFQDVVQGSFQVFRAKKVLSVNKGRMQVNGIPDLAVKPRKLHVESQADKIHAAILVGEVKRSSHDVETAHCNQSVWYAEGVLRSWPQVLLDSLEGGDIRLFVITTNLKAFQFMEIEKFPSTHLKWSLSKSELILDRQLIAKEILNICLAAAHMLESIPEMTYAPRDLVASESEPGNEGSRSSQADRGGRGSRGGRGGRGSQSTGSTLQHKGASAHGAKGGQDRGRKQQGHQDHGFYAYSGASTIPRNHPRRKKQAKSSKSSLPVPLVELRALLGEFTLDERISIYLQNRV